MTSVSDKQSHTIGPFVAGLANVPAETDLPVSETGHTHMRLLGLHQFEIGAYGPSRLNSNDRLRVK